MILSAHLADVGARKAYPIVRKRPSRSSASGLRYALTAVAAPLSGHVLPAPTPGRVGLIAAWDDDESLDRFLAGHPLAEQLAGGWHVRLAPTRIVGAWPRLADLPREQQPMDDSEPAAVLTIGRLRLANTLRFLRASAAAEELAVRDPALLASTGLARPPSIVATFSLWRTVAAMRDYASGHAEPGHLAATRAHAVRPFHHESAFIRFRPYRSRGSWGGGDPLTGAGVS